MARAGLYNFVIEQGADWFTLFRFLDADSVPISLVDAVITFAARSRVGDAEPVIEATSVDSDGIEIVDEDAGEFAMNREAAVTAEYPIGTYIYNYEITSPTIGTVRFLEGQCEVSADVNT